MNDNYKKYISPFCTRYASEEMQYIFSPHKKIVTFRKLWTALARAQKELGLPITTEQVSQLEANIENIDWDAAELFEKKFRHDVMAHIHAFGIAAPLAKGIIHLGATSCYVGDNTDIIVMKEAFCVIRRKILNVINNLAMFAKTWKYLPCLSYTHLQPAQLSTVGKRACLWINELLMDYQEIEYRISNLPFLGQKGTTGTQASFLELFEDKNIFSTDNDNLDFLNEVCDKLEKKIAEEMGFENIVPVSGQTYSRKIDSFCLNTLSGIAQTASKFSSDLRILANFKEMEEPFEENQIGSSAMPYKRNPMRAERITALSRYVITNSLNPAFTAANQWFERTLDDSANKRIAVAESFLGVDAILNIYMNITANLVVYPKVVTMRVMNEIPFMATENIMMNAVKKGGDRQILHEKLRLHSIDAGAVVKKEGGKNDLVKRISNDPDFNLSEKEILEMLKPEKFIGRSPEQVEIFLKEKIAPLLMENKDILGEKAELFV